MEGKKRVELIDEVRGAAIILIVGYHLMYDLVELYGVAIPAFHTVWMDTFRDILAGTFIFISGVACRFSRNNLKRGVVCLGLGMVLTFVTAVVMPEEPILFGILHLLGCCMLLFALTERFWAKLPLGVGVALCAVLFVCTRRMADDFFGIPGLFELPHLEALTASGLFFPFGIIRNDFVSADYFPLLPWAFLFLAGTFVGVPIRDGKAPAGFYRKHLPPLAAVGRHTIWIYLIHQPVLLAVCWLLFEVCGL